MTQPRTFSTQDTKDKIKLPNFLIIGAGKSGTTSLYHYLSAHPNVFMSPYKEPQFFAYEGERLVGWTEHRISKGFERAGIEFHNPYKLETYQQLFRGVQNEAAVGEASTQYLYRSKAVSHIKHHIPLAKIVVILRHPADRAFSQFSMNLADGHESLKSFRAALAAEPERITSNWPPTWHYTQMGFYYRQLRPYYEAFGAENMFVCLYEDLRRDPEQLIRNLFSFLGVDKTFKPDTDKRHNVARLHPRSDHIRRFVRKPHPLKTALRSVLPKRFYQQVAETVLRWNQTKLQLSPRLQRELTHLYRDDIIQLQDLIGRDLSHWLGSPPPNEKA